MVATSVGVGFTPTLVVAELPLILVKSFNCFQRGSHMRPRMDFYLVLHGEYL